MHAAIGVERFGLKAFLRLMTFQSDMCSANRLSITSSARAGSVSGTVRPSAFGGLGADFSSERRHVHFLNNFVRSQADALARHNHLRCAMLSSQADRFDVVIPVL
jgi:hypothetical protein